MAAYIILDIEVKDPAVYEEYKKMTPVSLGVYGGKFLVRGGKAEVLEGDWNPKRLVVLEFESAARAKEWLNSPEYREARQLRHRAARTNSVVVEGA